MQSDKWDSRQRWTGDPKPIAREIRAQMARHDEHQNDILNLIGVQRQALNRRLRGETKWHRWELLRLANHWGLTLNGLIPENHVNGTSVTQE